MISPQLLRRPKNAGKERKPPAKKEKTERNDFLLHTAEVFEVDRDGGKQEGGSPTKKKAREDRVNEMASKHELNGGRKETRSNLSYLGCLQTPFSAHEVFQSLDSRPALLKGARC